MRLGRRTQWVNPGQVWRRWLQLSLVLPAVPRSSRTQSDNTGTLCGWQGTEGTPFLLLLQPVHTLAWAGASLQDPPSAAMVWRTLGTSNFSVCPNGSVRWIWDVFGECAQDGWDEASVGLGLVSILCFAASTFPQYIKACKTGNMDQALSLWFLLGWIGGDSCNLIGSFLADQLPLQVGGAQAQEGS